MLDCDRSLEESAVKEAAKIYKETNRPLTEYQR